MDPYSHGPSLIETYLTTTAARVNIQLGARHYLLQQNWVNGRKGHCAMSYLD